MDKCRGKLGGSNHILIFFKSVLNFIKMIKKIGNLPWNAISPFAYGVFLRIWITGHSHIDFTEALHGGSTPYGSHKWASVKKICECPVIHMRRKTPYVNRKNRIFQGKFWKNRNVIRLSWLSSIVSHFYIRFSCSLCGDILSVV